MIRSISALMLFGSLAVAAFAQSSPSPGPSPWPTMSGMPSAASSASATKIPTCATDDPVVWVEPAGKVYSMKGDPTYAKTPNGVYMCKSAAVAAGNKPLPPKSSNAKSPAATATGGTITTNATPVANPTPTAAP